MWLKGQQTSALFSWLQDNWMEPYFPFTSSHENTEHVIEENPKLSITLYFKIAPTVFLS